MYVVIDEEMPPNSTFQAWYVRTCSMTPLSATVVAGPTGRDRYTHVEPPL